MKHLLSILIAAILCATASAQTIKSLGFNTTNGQVVANTTNALHFTNDNIAFNSGDLSLTNGVFRWGSESRWSPEDNSFDLPLAFNGTNTVSSTRANLGFSTNLSTLWTATNASNARSAVALGATWLTNTNVTNFRTSIGLGADNIATFKGIEVTTSATNADLFIGDGGDIVGDGDLFIGAGALIFQSALEFSSNSLAATTRTNLGLPLAALTNSSNVTMMRALSGSTNTNHPFSGTVDIIDGNMDSHNVTISNGIIVNWQAP